MDTTHNTTAKKPGSRSTDRKGRAVVEKKGLTLKELKIEYVSVSSIHPNSYNPNRQSDHDFHLLILSILEDGFTQPIVCQQVSHDIIDGEHRWTAQIVVAYLRQEGISDPDEELTASLRTRRLELLNPATEIPVVFTEMTPEQMRIATLRHNRARGSEDIELSAQVLRDLQAMGALDWAQDSLMLDDTEINRLLEDIPAPEALAGDEFHEAWVPDKIGMDDQGILASGSTEGRVVSQTEGNTFVTAMSAQAVEDARRREKAIAAATSAEERQMAQRTTELYRLSLMFSGEEAVIVKSVLGKEPAERLLALCRASQASNP